MCARARSGRSVQTKMGFLIFGNFGTWKSSLCLQFARMKREDGKPFRVLYIDAEAGSVDSYLELLEQDGIDTGNIYLVYTQSLGEVREYIHKASINEDFLELDEDGNETDTVVLDADGEPFRADAIVVDGTSIIYIATQQGLIEYSKKRAKVRAKQKELTGDERQVSVEGAGLEIKDYNTLKFKGQDLILDLLATGKHFAVTSRETDEKTQVKLADGTTTSVATGKKIPEGFKGLDYNVKTVLHTFVAEDGMVKAIVENKDRTLVHMQNEVIEEPSLLDWETVITKNKGKKEFVIVNNLQKSVKAEQKIYENEIDNASGENDSTKENEIKETPEYFHEQIAEIINRMTPQKKKTLKTTVEKEGLPLKYKELEDIDKLKLYVQIISK